VGQAGEGGEGFELAEGVEPGARLGAVGGLPALERVEDVDVPEEAELEQDVEGGRGRLAEQGDAMEAGELAMGGGTTLVEGVVEASEHGRVESLGGDALEGVGVAA
jgi:hypothetical protein